MQVSPAKNTEYPIFVRKHLFLSKPTKLRYNYVAVPLEDRICYSRVLHRLTTGSFPAASLLSIQAHKYTPLFKPLL